MSSQSQLSPCHSRLGKTSLYIKTRVIWTNLLRAWTNAKKPGHTGPLQDPDTSLALCPLHQRSSMPPFPPPLPPPRWPMVKASAPRVEDPGFESRLRRDFSGSSHTCSDLKIGTPVAALPGAWRYRVSAGTGRPGVSLLRLGEMGSWICNFCLSVAARKLV